jgi:hypothetical protein
VLVYGQTALESGNSGCRADSREVAERACAVPRELRAAADRPEVGPASMADARHRTATAGSTALTRHDRHMMAADEGGAPSAPEDPQGDDRADGRARLRGGQPRRDRPARARVSKSAFNREFAGKPEVFGASVSAARSRASAHGVGAVSGHTRGGRHDDRRGRDTGAARLARACLGRRRGREDGPRRGEQATSRDDGARLPDSGIG